MKLLFYLIVPGSLFNPRMCVLEYNINMKYIKKLTRTTAPTYFNQYIGTKEENLNIFFSLLEYKGISSNIIDFSIDSLIPIWNKVSKCIMENNILEKPNYKNPPIWTYIELEYIGDKERGYYSEETLWLLDGMAYYFGEILKNNIKDSFWGICDFKISPKLVNHLKPVLFNVKLWDGYSPLSLSFTHFSRVRFEDMRDAFSEENFYNSLNNMLTITKKKKLEGFMIPPDKYLYT